MLKKGRRKAVDGFGKNKWLTPADFYHYPREVKGRFGLELELEGKLPIEPLPGGWSSHRDGSVPNGVEYVTAEPHGMIGLMNRVEELNKFFKTAGAEIQNSHRGSTHVHFNVRQEKWIHILGFIILETLIEPILLRMCGGNRDGNLFCLPSYDTGDISFFFDDLLSHIASHGEYAFPYRGKYSSMNTNPIPHLGSTEFRMFPPTVSWILIERWCHWISNMMEIARTEDDLTYRDMVINLKRDPSILWRIFREDVSEFCHPYPVHELIMFGSRQAHELRRLLSHYTKGKPKGDDE